MKPLELASLPPLGMLREVVSGRYHRRRRKKGRPAVKAPLSEVCQVPDPRRRDRLEVTVLAMNFCGRLVETLGRS